MKFVTRTQMAKIFGHFEKNHKSVETVVISRFQYKEMWDNKSEWRQSDVDWLWHEEKGICFVGCLWGANIYVLDGDSGAVYLSDADIEVFNAKPFIRSIPIGKEKK
jgi:hypothetical protein